MKRHGTPNSMKSASETNHSKMNTTSTSANTSTNSNSNPIQSLASRLRDKVNDLISHRSFESAAYWADKLIILSKGETQDIILLLECYLSSKQYKRAIGLFQCDEYNHLIKKKTYIRYIAAQCHFALNEWDDAQDILGENTEALQLLCEDYSTISMNIKSAICLLRGKIYEALDNRLRASNCYQEALVLDIYCREALDRLISERMLTPKQAEDFISSLAPEFISQGRSDGGFIVELYLSDVGRLGPTISASDDNPTEGAAIIALQSLDIQMNQAEVLYYSEHNAPKCLAITKKILERDPYHLKCLALHACCLVCTGGSSELFALGHKLVQADAESAVTWFVVGCYYLSIGQYETARKYFSKSTANDVRFAPAWVAFGHSFAAEGEFDTALASYSTVARLLNGSYLPLVFIGSCHLRSNNIEIAEQFFNEAFAIDSSDPLVIGELGIIAYRNKEYQEAKNRFTFAIRLATKDSQFSTNLLDIWEPLVFNLGNCCRKLREFQEAIECYEKALALFPRNPSTLSSLGLCYQYLQDYHSAIDVYHKSLALQPDEPIASALLPLAIKELNRNELQ